MKYIPPRLIPDDTKYPFMKLSRFGFFVSGILCSIAILLFVFVGLSYGVDFKGGTSIAIRTEQAANLDELRGKVDSLGLGNAELQEFGSPRDVLIKLQAVEGGDAAQQGIIAVVTAIAGILIYVWFRFEWQFALGAVMSLLHDVTLTIGLFCILKIEFNLQIIAAILTIIGYSLNDTVVVFDRIREYLPNISR